MKPLDLIRDISTLFGYSCHCIQSIKYPTIKGGPITGDIKNNSIRWELPYAARPEQVNKFSISGLTYLEEIALGNRNHITGMAGIGKSLTAQPLEIG
jgi:hypothetical protein